MRPNSRLFHHQGVGRVILLQSHGRIFPHLCIVVSSNLRQGRCPAFPGPDLVVVAMDKLGPQEVPKQNFAFLTVLGHTFKAHPGVGDVVRPVPDVAETVLLQADVGIAAHALNLHPLCVPLDVGYFDVIQAAIGGC